MKIFLTLAMLSVLQLLACTSNSSKDVTISVLTNKKLKLEEKSTHKLKRENTPKFYRNFLKTAAPGDMYNDALRRLADIELQSGLDLSLSNSRTKQSLARKKINVAIKLYNKLLKTTPDRKTNDLVYYQLAKAYDLNLEKTRALEALNLLVKQHPDSRYFEETQFRLGETNFVMKNYKQAQQAYASIIKNFPKSQYYEKSLYKFGWSSFKQLRYTDSTNAFIKLLDIKYKQGQLLDDGPAITLSRSNKELLNDVLRVTSLSFSYQQGHISINKYFSAHGKRPYESMIYNNLAELYLSKNRIRDAANTFLAYSKQYPTSSIAPKYHSKAINAYNSGGFSSMVIPSKISFVSQYGVNTPYWKAQDLTAQKSITPLLKKHIRELASHFHAAARKVKIKRDKKSTPGFVTRSEKVRSKSNYIKAISWYSTYIISFPQGKKTGQINFLLAEAYQDANKYRSAIVQFEKTAYLYPQHKKKSEAAYAALLLYPVIQRNLKGVAKSQWQQKKISSALKYVNTFPKNKFTPSILVNTAEELFKTGDYKRAMATASRLNVSSKSHKKLMLSLLLIKGHSAFELKKYAESETTYRDLITKLPRKHKELNNVRDRLAASIYKQGETAKANAKLDLAAMFFLRVGKDVPSSRLRATADYDAATIYIKIASWKKAQRILERFRKKYPKNHKHQFGVTEKLALVYSKTGKPLKAANEMVYLATKSNNYNAAQRRDLLWEAAKTYNDNNRKKTAYKILNSYVKQYPLPLEQAIEARQLLADFNKKSNSGKYFYWLKQIIKADNNGGKHRTQRTQFLAASAYMELTLPLFKSYKLARLKIPLKKSLNKKKKLMQQVVKSYDNALKYRVAEITTSATYYIAEIYNDFADALLNSQRPKKLSADELDEYNVLLEEQAFPFEEKAIDIHAANAQRVKDNIYDNWVKLSIKALSKLNPIRYAKAEKGEAYVQNIN